MFAISTHPLGTRLKPALLPRSTNVLPLRAPTTIELFVEALVIVAGSVLSGIGYHWIALHTLGDGVAFVATGILTAAIFCGLIRLIGDSHPLGTTTAARRASDAFLAWVLSFSLLLLLAFTLKFEAQLSRGAIWTFFLAGLVAVVPLHINIGIFLSRAKRMGAIEPRAAILIGARGDSMLDGLAAEMRYAAQVNPVIVTFDPFCDSTRWAHERQTLRDKVLDLARPLGAGEIFLAASPVSFERLNAVLSDLALLPRSVFVIPDAATRTFLRHPMAMVGRSVAVKMQNEPLGLLERTVKRVIDLALATGFLLLISPVMTAVAIGVKLDSRGPVLFRQSRTGYRGRPFEILKFRTMTVQENGATVTQASIDDERITRFGRWLRRSSLDELPQLINVIKGDMSLVGPRPHALAHDDFYATIIENYQLRQHVLPGVTGWAQVNGYRGETATPDQMCRRVEHDLWYMRNCSIWLDLQIFARTIITVVSQKNAH